MTKEVIPQGEVRLPFNHHLLTSIDSNTESLAPAKTSWEHRWICPQGMLHLQEYRSYFNLMKSLYSSLPKVSLNEMMKSAIDLSEVQDFSMGPKKSSSMYGSKSKLDDTLTKLMKKNNCVSVDFLKTYQTTF